MPILGKSPRSVTFLPAFSACGVTVLSDGPSTKWPVWVMAGAGRDLYPRDMEHNGDLIDAPAVAMAARIAALWRAQGDDFLQAHHRDQEVDVARLRTAVVVEPDAPPRAERLVERLRRLDAAAIERVAAGRPDAVVDLTGAEPVVRVPNQEDGRDAPAPHAWNQECRRCGQYFPDELLVRPDGDKVRPLCLDCALVFSGLRRRR
jgi:hypothetical protein